MVNRMIEKKIFNRLIENKVILEYITKYEKRPAVFYGEAASDMDVLWEKKVFPRVDYSIEWEADPERKSVGILLVNIWCLNKGKQPEEMVNGINEDLNNCFFSDESGVYCTSWDKNVTFNGSREDPVTNGITMIYDIMAFPNQRTIKPDPAYGVQKFIKKCFNNFLVLEDDNTPDIFMATRDRPVTYVRISEIKSNNKQDIFALRWKNCAVNIHLFAPDVNDANKILRMMEQRFSMEGECIMDDGGPLFIKSGTIDLNANPLKKGQLTFLCEYAVPVYQTETEKIKEVILK